MPWPHLRTLETLGRRECFRRSPWPEPADNSTFSLLPSHPRARKVPKKHQNSFGLMVTG